MPRPGRKPTAEPVGKPNRSAALDPGMVLLGEFGRPHGLHGEIRLKSYTADPLAIASYGRLTTGDGGEVSLEAVRPAPGAAADLLISRVVGIRGRESAEKLNRVTLYCARDRLGTIEEDDEFFAADLVGAEAVDVAGVVIGRVVAVPNFGGGDLLEIRPAVGGPSALLPFTKAFVPTLDLEGRRVVIAPPDDFFAPPGQRPAEDRD